LSAGKPEADPSGLGRDRRRAAGFGMGETNAKRLSVRRVVGEVRAFDGIGFGDGDDGFRCSFIAGVIDEPHDPGAIGSSQVVVAPFVSVESDEELVMLARFIERQFEEFFALFDGESIVLHIANDVSPAEIPGFEGGRGGEVVFEFRDGEEAARSSPFTEDGFVVCRDVLARTFGETDVLRSAATRENERRHQNEPNGPVHHLEPQMSLNTVTQRASVRSMRKPVAWIQPSTRALGRRRVVAS